LEDAETPIKKANRIRALNEAIDTIESLARPDQKYSHFCKVFLEKNKPYQAAVLKCGRASVA
ncbi:MAG: hypothetical protein NWR85_00150, partial [Limnohabitans sp.]|nr:hypothetical protein [Limnohabitans sp.]